MKTAIIVAALLLAGTARSQEVISILPGDSIGTTTITDPYQYSTTWTDEAGNTYEHVTITNPDGSSVDFHYIGGTLVGTLFSDANGGWTYIDGSGRLVYADTWDEKLSDYVVLYGDYADWVSFETQVLDPIAFFGAPSIYYGDTLFLGAAGGIATMSMQSADGSSASSAPIYNVTGRARGLLTALSKLGSHAFVARVELLSQLTREPRANQAARAKRGSRQDCRRTGRATQPSEFGATGGRRQCSVAATISAP